METNRAINKIVDLCRKARVASLVLFCICLAAAALCAVSAVMNYPNIYTKVQHTGDATVVATSAYALTRCIGGFVLSVLYGAGLFICSNMFAGITENGTPFRSETAGALKKISLIMLMSAVLPSFISTVFLVIMDPPGLRAQPLRMIASNSGLSVGIVPLFLALFVYIMAIVFSYGSLLQQESDETL